MNCSKHLETAAQGTCTYCGKFFCEDCLVEVDGKMVCRDDVSRMYQEAKTTTAQAAQPAPVNVNVSNINTNTNTNTNAGGIAVPRKSRVAALLLCFFLGGFGIHRFYVGKVGTGFLYLFTGGLFGIGWLIDLILLIIGTFKDKYGYPLA